MVGTIGVVWGGRVVNRNGNIVDSVGKADDAATNHAMIYGKYMNYFYFLYETCFLS